MKLSLNSSEQELADKLLEKNLFLVKYTNGWENRFAVYVKDPSYQENLVDDNILIDTEASISDLLSDLKIIFRVFGDD
jgi:hypothetical protein